MTGNQLTEIEIRVEKLHFKYNFAAIVGKRTPLFQRWISLFAGNMRNIFMIILRG
jgi:hypothetical protein